MRRLAVLLPTLLALTPANRAAAVPAEPHGSPASWETTAGQAVADLPLTFIDVGDGSVPFRTITGAADIGFGRDGVRMALRDTSGTTQSWGIHVTFPGARTVEPVAGRRTPGIVSVFRGPPSEWRTGLRTYELLRYEELWPGIDLHYRGGTGSLKYEFRLQPGANPEAIGLDWGGAMVTRESGALRIATPAGSLLDEAPIAWQPGSDGRVSVEAGWDPRPDGTWGFAVGPYDPTRPLVIDPVMAWSGFLGGSEDDGGQDVASDPSGAAYVVGQTRSTGPTNDFPASVGPDTTYNGASDVWVAKIDPSGKQLVYAGFIGGDQDENAEGIDVDGTGAAYLGGRANSSTADGFPTLVGPDTTYNGGQDDFVAKVKPDGTGLVYAGYIGGTNFENYGDVAVDGAGAAYVAGGTASGEGDGFTLSGGPDLSFNGDYDAFIAKVRPDGSGFAYAGYIGGTDTEIGRGVAVDGAGAAYVAGDASSTPGQGFPASGGPDITFGGGTDAFVAKVQPTGSALAYAGYIGGTDGDGANRLAVDPSGAAYVVGSTRSDQGPEGFPAIGGPDTTFGGPSGMSGGNGDAFIAKVQPNGSGFAYAGYIGGTGSDGGEDVEVDGAGAAYVAGSTDSSEGPGQFPATGGPDVTFNGDFDAFAGKVRPEGTGFDFLSYLGGPGGEDAFGAALDGSGGMYLTGDADSASFPATVGPDTTFNGDFDAFVARLAAATCKGRDATIVGVQTSERIRGTSGRDVIAALGGNDAVRALAGRDLVCGGRGNDRLNGGGGNDKLLGQQGKDRLSGGSGRDLCVGGPKRDRAACEKERQI